MGQTQLLHKCGFLLLLFGWISTIFQKVYIFIYSLFVFQGRSLFCYFVIFQNVLEAKPDCDVTSENHSLLDSHVCLLLLLLFFYFSSYMMSAINM